ncbi:hypothetical protein GA0061099_101210 [Bradyrhizobium yuanmingense]|uniref:Uncharacterized protein n=1 Tax=Bradyrhizobium yuanmingense TaxID=108015 RepID=A0A1C3XD97_9BRAD|nr:hypothetical protein IQ15_06674 [Bradyrhizobium yuanmingense]SCB50115.1 hypothetical protein GA0061099_101210 [Bradyrhizobium yuanmingense]
MKKPRSDDRGTFAGTGNNCRGILSFRSGPQDRNDSRETYVADAAAGWKTKPKPSMQ